MITREVVPICKAKLKLYRATLKQTRYKMYVCLLRHWCWKKTKCYVRKLYFICAIYRHFFVYGGIYVCLCKISINSTHRGTDKLATLILQATFSNAFCLNISIVWSKFLLNLLLRAQLTTCQHWLWWWLSTGDKSLSESIMLCITNVYMLDSVSMCLYAWMWRFKYMSSDWLIIGLFIRR